MINSEEGRDELEVMAEKAKQLIKDIYEEGIATINGHDYHFTKTTHAKRVEVYAYTTKVAPLIQKGNMSFLSTPEWKNIERIINNIVLYDDCLLSKLKEHWESDEFSKDYVNLMITSLRVICYPLS